MRTRLKNVSLWNTTYKEQIARLFDLNKEDVDDLVKKYDVEVEDEIKDGVYQNITSDNMYYDMFESEDVTSEENPDLYTKNIINEGIVSFTIEPFDRRGKDCEKENGEIERV